MTLTETPDCQRGSTGQPHLPPQGLSPACFNDYLDAGEPIETLSLSFPASEDPPPPTPPPAGERPQVTSERAGDLSITANGRPWSADRESGWEEECESERRRPQVRGLCATRGRSWRGRLREAVPGLGMEGVSGSGGKPLGRSLPGSFRASGWWVEHLGSSTGASWIQQAR